MSEKFKPVNTTVPQAIAHTRGQRALMRRGKNPQRYSAVETRRYGYGDMIKNTVAIGAMAAGSVAMGAYALHQLDKGDPVGHHRPNPVEEQRKIDRTILNEEITQGAQTEVGGASPTDTSLPPINDSPAVRALTDK